PEYCPPALTETTYFKCQVTNPCETDTTDIVTAFVWDEFVAGEIVADQDICYNTVPACLSFSIIPTGGDTIVGYTYQWYDSFGVISGAINSTYCPPALLLTETYYCEVTNPCGVLNTNTVTITVWDEFFAGLIGFDVDPCHILTDTICSGDIPGLIGVCQNPTGGEPGIYTYQWQIDTLCNGSWYDIAGATNPDYQPQALINPSILDDGPISYCFRRIDMNLCDTIPTNSVEVVVNSLPRPFEIIGEEMVCAYTTHQYCVYPIGVDDPYTYSWSVTGGILDPTNCCDTCAIIDWGVGPLGVIIVTKENINTGCQISDTLYVQINPIPNPVITGPAIVDEGEIAVYSVPLLPNQLYSWFVTGGVIQSGGGTNEVTVTWGPAGMGHILISQKDNIYPYTGCCGFGEMDVTINPVGLPTISGVVTYNNAYSTPMNNVDVDLRDIFGVVVQSTTTHFDFGTLQNGYHDFYNVLNGDYTFDVSTGIPFGGVNATDALAIKLHAIAQPGFILTGLPLVCADVNNSGTVNATDALYVIYRTINYITSFPAGDWAFDDQPLVITGTPIVNDFMGECYGDVNGSYIPTGYKDSYNYELLTEGTRNIEPGDVFELPVRVLNKTKLGAMSLFFNYQDELVEVIDVTTIDNDNMLYTVDDNLIRIAWSNTNAYSLENDEIVLTLKLQALADITYDDQLINLSEGTEFADEFANVIENMTLKTLGVSTTGMMGYALSHNFPNPFNEYTDIQYTIPENGRIVLSVYDILGNKVATLVDAVREAGTYTERFLVQDNNPGVYIYELQVDGVTTDYTDLKKMVIK
ncbi:MAG: T9SS type A sorting domain-containing protein, partial [Bacteroidales bacterium]|nr:T9SS type A sorting domain-containing protein [Bacteroidales bacterium]